MNKNWTLFILVLFASVICTCQTTIPKDSSSFNKPEIFTNGFIDVLSNGQMNASARFIRLYIGEQAKFAIPLSFYSGVSANNFQNHTLAYGQKSNEHLVNAFINPLSGLINLSSEGLIFLKRSVKVTKPGFIYHIGLRVLTGHRQGSITDPLTGSPVNFMNSIAATGLYFQTGAWEKNNTKNLGILWFAVRYHSSYSNPGKVNDFLPLLKTNGLYTGYSSGFGVAINNLIHLKAIYYKYTKGPEWDYTAPIYQFSFNYSMK